MKEMEMEQRIIELINNGVRSIILSGAPGCGKTRMARRIAEKYGNDSSKFIRFHPSYTYEDMMDRLAPKTYGNTPENEEYFVSSDGLFKRYCYRIANDNEKPEYFREESGLYFFVIDDIGRCDISEVFGEFAGCLDADHRGKEHKVVLKNSGIEYEFYIPENIVIIGTLSEAEPAIWTTDPVLRRSFTWVEFPVDEEMLKESLTEIFKKNTHPVNELCESILYLNDLIVDHGYTFGMDRDDVITQGQFVNLGISEEDTLEDIRRKAWEYHIEPLLKSYLRGQDRKEAEGFLRECRERFFFAEEVRNADLRDE